MNSDPLVSIILPTFNGEKFLHQAVQSCLDLIYKNWELIIVDDASTDSTPDIIKYYTNADNRIKTVRNNTNLKLPSSLNVGFDHSKGLYISWISDDNLYRPTAISVMLEFLQKSSEVDLVYTDYSTINANGELIEIKTMNDFRNLAFGNCVGACFLYKREVHVALNGYSNDMYLAEDYDFWLRASKKFRLEVLHRDLYLYRCHEESLTNKNHKRILQVTIHTLLKHLPNLPWLGKKDKAKAYIILTRQAIQCNDYILARKLIRLALRSNYKYVIYRELKTIILCLPIGRYLKKNCSYLKEYMQRR